MSEEAWYVAEYVMAIDFDGQEPHEYQIANYVIKARSDDSAYEKASKLKSSLGSSFDTGFGEIQNTVCVGFHQLDHHWDANNGDVIHINTTNLLFLAGSPPKPRIREKHELNLFLHEHR